MAGKGRVKGGSRWEMALGAETAPQLLLGLGGASGRDRSVPLGHLEQQGMERG